MKYFLIIITTIVFFSVINVQAKVKAPVYLYFCMGNGYDGQVVLYHSTSENCVTGSALVQLQIIGYKK